MATDSTRASAPGSTPGGVEFSPGVVAIPSPLDRGHLVRGEGVSVLGASRAIEARNRVVVEWRNRPAIGVQLVRYRKETHRRMGEKSEGFDREAYRMNSERCKALIEEFGSGNSAARALGVSQSTFWKWCNPERAKEVNSVYKKKWRTGLIRPRQRTGGLIRVAGRVNEALDHYRQLYESLPAGWTL